MYVPEQPGFRIFIVRTFIRIFEYAASTTLKDLSFWELVLGWEDKCSCSVHHGSEQLPRVRNAVPGGPKYHQVIINSSLTELHRVTAARPGRGETREVRGSLRLQVFVTGRALLTRPTSPSP